jgi:aspartyl-tRNA(Asn)/glutamyl-tRNA(Gln) amidotransferase subunit A
VDIGGVLNEVRPTYTRFTSPISLTGLPAISVPCGFTSAGLPIGLQLVGNFLGEPTLLSLAHAYESATDWHKRRPPID